MDKELKYYNFIISKFEISEAFSFTFIGSKSYAQINSKVFLSFGGSASANAPFYQ